MSHLGNVKALDGCVLGVSARTERATPVLQLDAVGSEMLVLEEKAVRELVRLGVAWLTSLSAGRRPAEADPSVWKVSSPSAELLCSSPAIANEWAKELTLDTCFQERVLVYEVLVHDFEPKRDAKGRLVWEKA